MNVVEETETILHCTRSCHTYTNFIHIHTYIHANSYWKAAQMCLARVVQRLHL